MSSQRSTTEARRRSVFMRDHRRRMLRVRFALVAIIVCALGLASAAVRSAPTEAAVSFNLSVAPKLRTVVAGEATAFEARITGRVPRTFTMRASNLPPGVAAKFLSTNSRSRRIVLFQTSVETPPALYSVIVELVADDAVRTVALTLATTQPAGPRPPTPPQPTILPPPPPPTTAASTTTIVTTSVPTTTVPPPLVLRLSRPSSTVTPGQTTAFDVTPEPLFVTIRYVVNGTPANTVVDITPNPSFGRVTVTVRTSPTTPPGIYPLTITAVSDRETKTVVFALDVLGSVGLVASPQSQVVPAGTMATYVIAVVSAPSANALTFSASGLPFGATAAFSPVSSTVATILTITTAQSSPIGTYPISVTATDGATVRFASLQLVVSSPGGTPGFGLNVTPPTAEVARGSATTYVVTISPRGGFSGPVNIVLADLPTGVSGTFVTDTTTPNIVGRLVLAVSSSTPIGSTTFRVTATSPGTTLTATVSVVIKIT